MRFSSILSASGLLAGVVLAKPQDTSSSINAPAINDSPLGAYALADMPAGGAKDIFAQVSFATAQGGKGVDVTLNVNGGIPRQGGPFRKISRFCCR
jgi:hypothetical protein